MDTKWKNRKKVVSFLIFVVGVSLVLNSVLGILRIKPGGVKIWQFDKLLEEDYQRSERFRNYIASRLENFLIMAVGGSGLGSVWQSGDGTYYSFGYDGVGYEGFDYGYDSSSRYAYKELSVYEGSWDSAQEQYDVAEDYIDALSDTLDGLQSLYDNFCDIILEGIGTGTDSYGEELNAYRKEIEGFRQDLRSYRSELGGIGAREQDTQNNGNSGTDNSEDALKERNLKMIQKYHDWIKGDQNLLYSISYDGKPLYSNGELSVQEGGVTAPEGYNFLLYFDGEKVTITKDGEKMDVYGDGYYRDGSGSGESGWYVPGYRNFPVNEELKKVTVCMAVAKEPALYVDGSYENGGSRKYDNTLYWMDYNFQANRNALLEEWAYLAAGVALLLLSFVLRKSRKEANIKIARMQAKVWAECKLLYFILLCAAVIFYMKNNPYGLWNEFTYYLYEDYGMGTASAIGREMLESIPPVLVILIFWSFYLLWNDLKHNKKIWKHGLGVKLYRTFSAKGINQPLSKTLARRNAVVFACAAVFGILMIGMALSGLEEQGSIWHSMWLNQYGAVSTSAGAGPADIWSLRFGILAVIGTLCFLAVAYLTGKKNMETAKDLEALSRCVGEIRNGNYGDVGGDFSGHDLEKLMEQMEDIRCGMAKAVDEQMKSERMKVELIANVSHDIKTPLTSIISYVQFLKQEEGLPDHVKDYVAILDEKSQRLKNMVQDVFAVSKAASGELPMHMEELDFGKLLRQTLADMEEEIGKSPVVFRTEIPQEPVMIMADGQRMYRVFQNLFQNAIKYSLEGSRVYVALKEEGQLAVASVKNTSHQELEKGMDFAERFSRGDKSRTDGGSGLGLSIAQSFTEACGGEFSWETDADLFVVKVSFQRISAEPKGF